MKNKRNNIINLLLVSFKQDKFNNIKIKILLKSFIIILPCQYFLFAVLFINKWNLSFEFREKRGEYLIRERKPVKI